MANIFKGENKSSKLVDFCSGNDSIVFYLERLESDCDNLCPSLHFKDDKYLYFRFKMKRFSSSVSVEPVVSVEWDVFDIADLLDFDNSYKYELTFDILQSELKKDRDVFFDFVYDRLFEYYRHKHIVAYFSVERTIYRRGYKHTFYTYKCVNYRFV